MIILFGLVAVQIFGLGWLLVNLSKINSTIKICLAQLAPRVSLAVKFAPVCETCTYGPWSPLRRGEATKSNRSGFWTFWTSKLSNFKTRLWTRDTCHVYSEGTCG